MDLNSSLASRIVREELTETEEGGSLTQRLQSRKPKDGSAGPQEGPCAPGQRQRMCRDSRRSADEDTARRGTSLGSCFEMTRFVYIHCRRAITGSPCTGPPGKRAERALPHGQAQPPEAGRSC